MEEFLLAALQKVSTSYEQQEATLLRVGNLIKAIQVGLVA
jgi:hypothetical protein